MRILLDTNILIRASQPNLPEWPDIRSALTLLLGRGFELCIVPQNIYEFWVVATRPSTQNGFGLDAARTAMLADQLIANFTLLRDERGVFNRWLEIVRVFSVVGKTAHDARLIAAMQRHSISHLLTINKTDFARFPIAIYTPSDILAGSMPIT